MVQTRSSYSKSGTPLASPLNNPERKKTDKRNSRNRNRNRGNQSTNLADISTSSFICSPDTTLSSYTANTPVSPSFSQELINRLSQSSINFNHLGSPVTQELGFISQSTPTQLKSESQQHFIEQQQLELETNSVGTLGRDIKQQQPEIETKIELESKPEQSLVEHPELEQQPEQTLGVHPQLEPEPEQEKELELEPELQLESTSKDILDQQETIQQQPVTSSTKNHMSEADEGEDQITQNTTTEDLCSRSSSQTAIDAQDPTQIEESSSEEKRSSTPAETTIDGNNEPKRSEEDKEEDRIHFDHQHLHQHQPKIQNEQSSSSDEDASSTSEESDTHDESSEEEETDNDQSQSDTNDHSHESDDEKIKHILQRARQEAKLFENQSTPIEELVTGGGEGVASSDCASSTTFGKNWIKLDDQLENQKGKLEKKNSILSKPIKISHIEKKLFKDHLGNGSNSSSSKSKNSKIQSNSTSFEKMKETNFDRVLEVKQRQLGYSNSNLDNRNRSMDWHDLPAQELTKEVKMEIQAMRLHRTLDPKSFIKGGIEKATKEPIPSKFLFGYVHGGDGSTDGSINKSTTSIKKRSFVETLLHDDKSQEWTKKKYDQVQSSGRSGKHTKKKIRKSIH